MTQIFDGFRIENPQRTKKLIKKRTIRRSRRGKKKRLVRTLKKSHVTEERNIEESKKMFMNKSFIGNFSHDKLYINAHDLNKELKMIMQLIQHLFKANS